MEDRRDVYLGHMLEAARDALIYTEGMSKTDFRSDRRTQQAVILNLLIIGEAATKLIQNNSDFLEGHRHIAWQSMRGMRNRIAHGYFDINIDIVWDTVISELPGLIRNLEDIQKHVGHPHG
jgi:uncharacterized protein with HEPN domain